MTQLHSAPFNLQCGMALIDKIPKPLLIEYLERRITSEKLSELTGYHAASIRRGIKREPATPQPKNKSNLLLARKTFRATLSHLPAAEIQKQAHVSLSTANRIKKAGKDAGRTELTHADGTTESYEGDASDGVTETT